MHTESTPIGRSGIAVSRLGFGCCPLGGHGWGSFDREEATRAIRRALELGIRFFDTADVYGFGGSEETLGQTLEEILGPERSGVVVTTKFGVRWDASGKITKDSSPAYVRQAVEASLRRLGLDSIPLYQIHWPDLDTPLEATVETLLELKEEGKIQAFGVSNFTPELVEEVCRHGPVESHQFEYSLARRDAEEHLLPQARRRGLSVITWGSLAQGLFSGKYDASTRFSSDDRRHRYENFRGQRFRENLEILDRLRALAGLYGKEPSQIALRWLLDTPGVSVALTGIKTRSQIEQNAGALGWNLDPEHLEFLGAPATVQDPAVGASARSRQN